MKPKFFFVFLTVLLLFGCKNSGKSGSVQERRETPVVVGTGENRTNEPPATADPEKANQPPRITSVDVKPLTLKAGDVLTTEVTASDPDGDQVSLTYQWFKNDEPISETSNVLALKRPDFKRGDKIVLNVVPDDGITQGSPGRMTVTVGNSPPEITSSPNEGRIVNGIYTYHVRASDADGDTLTYAIKAGPQGVAVNPSTGLIQWSVPQGFKDETSLAVSVSDGQGGETEQRFALEITFAKPAGK